TPSNAPSGQGSAISSPTFASACSPSTPSRVWSCRMAVGDPSIAATAKPSRAMYHVLAPGPDPRSSRCTAERSRTRYHRDRSAVHLLDLGSGPGASTWYMAREGFAVAAIDGSPTAIRQLQTRLGVEGLQADAKVGELIALPWPDGAFEGV